MAQGTDFTTIEALTIAIVGSGSALLGAVAGFFGAWFIEGRRAKETKRGMVRALLGELRRNGTLIFGRMASGVAIPQLSSHTWESAQFELSGFLGRTTLDKLVSVYALLPAVGQFHSGEISTEQRRVLAHLVDDIGAAVDDLIALPLIRDLDEPPLSKWMSESVATDGKKVLREVMQELARQEPERSEGARSSSPA